MFVVTVGRDGHPETRTFTDLFPGLTWESRPDTTGSEAPESLVRAWVSTLMATRDVCGGVTRGLCMWTNFAARAVAERALGEPVFHRAGAAIFSTGTGTCDCLDHGRRWAPDKWRRAYGGAITAPLGGPDDIGDVHVWLETKTHVVDMVTFQIAHGIRETNEKLPGYMRGREGTWPPLVYWPLGRFPKVPQEAERDRVAALWRNGKALRQLMGNADLMANVAEIETRALEIFDAIGKGEKVPATEGRPAELALRIQDLWH